MMKKFVLAGALLLAAAFPALACGGQTDLVDNVKAQVASIDAYLQNPQKLQADRQAGKGGAEVSGVDVATLSRVRALRKQSGDLLAQALAQRAKTGQRSPLAARQLQAASEKSGEALLALGVPPVILPGAPMRCGAPRGSSPAS